MFDNWRLTLAITLVTAVVAAMVALPSPAAARLEPVPEGSAARPLFDRHLSRCLEDITSPSAIRRRAAARALRVLASPRAKDALSAALDETADEPLRREVAAALLALGEPRGERTLIELSRTGADRYLALIALGEGGGERSSERLREVFEGPEEMLRPAALRAMVQRREKGWEQAARLALVAPRWDLREAALGALRHAPADHCLGTLRSLLGSGSESTALAAAEALLAAGDTAGVAFLERSLSDAAPRVRGEAARILVTHGEAGPLPVLEEACTSGSQAERLALLGRMSAEPVPALIPLLENLSGSGPLVERIAAASALAALGEDRVLPVLDRAIDCGNELLRARALVATSRLLRAEEVREP